VRWSVWIAGTGLADHFIDISSTIDVKVKALRAHASQVGENVGEFIPQRAHQVGEPQGMKYAEGFKRIQLPG